MNENYTPENRFRTVTGGTRISEALQLRFLERIDLHPTRADEAVQTGPARTRYAPIQAPSPRGEPGREKWAYVLERGLGGHVSVKVEGQFDAEGTFRLVD